MLIEIGSLCRRKAFTYEYEVVGGWARFLIATARDSNYSCEVKPRSAGNVEKLADYKGRSSSLGR